MNLKRVPRRRRFLGGTLSSLGILLLLNTAAVRAQDEWQAAPIVPTTAEPPIPQIPPPFPPESSQTAQQVSARTVVEEENENRLALEVEQPPLPAGTQKLDLQGCITLALKNQPALAAAGADVGAAQGAYNGVASLPRFTILLSRDLNVRKLQACLGIQAAQAGYNQAEWDTRYAVTRNYFSVVYARLQSKQVQRIVDKLGEAHNRAKELVDKGLPDIKLTNIDVQYLYVAKEKTRAKRLTAAYGVRKAMDALHEAMGLRCDEPLDIIDDTLPPLVNELDVKELICAALAQRGEMSQAQILAQIMDLEITAQSKSLFKARAGTFAQGADIHAQPIPQGLNNGDYRPGAIGPAYPVSLFGPRWARVERAQSFSARASAVVEKTENLISLETKIAYWKWKESAEFIRIYQGDPKDKEKSLITIGDNLAKTIYTRFDQGKASGEEYLKARGAADVTVVEFNEALYNHALALIALERITAGGYRVFLQTP